jgi:hypothetical protein
MATFVVFKGQRKADATLGPSSEAANRVRVLWDETTIKKKDLLVLLEQIENFAKNAQDSI